MTLLWLQKRNMLEGPEAHTCESWVVLLGTSMDTGLASLEVEVEAGVEFRMEFEVPGAPRTFFS